MTEPSPVELYDAEPTAPAVPGATPDEKGRTRMPKEALDKLEAKRGMIDGCQWDAADLLHELCIELGRHFDRSEAGDALGISEGSVTAYIKTAERIDWRHEPGAESVSFSAFMLIARDKDPREFYDMLLQSMDDYGGKFPPCDVIRIKLAERKGKRSSRRCWTGQVGYNVDKNTGEKRVFVLLDRAEDYPDKGASVSVRVVS